MRSNESGIVAATFDVWETLIKDNPQLSNDRAQLRATRMAAVLQRHGYPVDATRVRQIYSQTLERLEAEVWSKYLDVDTREQLLVFVSILDPRLASSPDEAMLAELAEAYRSPIFDFPPALAPGASWVLAKVKEMGLRIGMVCNTGVTPGQDMRQLLAGYGVLDYFQALAFSDEERVRKPRPEIFRAALTRLGVAASQTVHIGDDAVADIAGAKDAGMRAIMVRASSPSRLPVPPDLHVADLFAVAEALEGL